MSSQGLFYYRVMPFRLKNTGATYLVNQMFNKKIGRNMEVYVDDMLIKSKEKRSHLYDLRETFEPLKQFKMKLNSMKCAFGVSSGKFPGFTVSQQGIEAIPEKVKAILEMSSPKTLKEKRKPTGRVMALNKFVSKAMNKSLPFFKTLKHAFASTDDYEAAFQELNVIRVTRHF